MPPELTLAQLLPFIADGVKYIIYFLIIIVFFFVRKYLSRNEKMLSELFEQKRVYEEHNSGTHKELYDRIRDLELETTEIKAQHKINHGE